MPLWLIASEVDDSPIDAEQSSALHPSSTCVAALPLSFLTRMLHELVLCREHAGRLKNLSDVISLAEHSLVAFHVLQFL